MDKKNSLFQKLLIFTVIPGCLLVLLLGMIAGSFVIALGLNVSTVPSNLRPNYSVTYVDTTNLTDSTIDTLQRFVYVKDNDIWLSTPDGKAQTPLGLNNVSIAYKNPSTNYITYQTKDPNDSNIWLINLVNNTKVGINEDDFFNKVKGNPLFKDKVSNELIFIKQPMSLDGKFLLYRFMWRVGCSGNCYWISQMEAAFGRPTDAIYAYNIKTGEKTILKDYSINDDTIQWSNGSTFYALASKVPLITNPDTLNSIYKFDLANNTTSLVKSDKDPLVLGHDNLFFYSTTFYQGQNCQPNCQTYIKNPTDKVALKYDSSADDDFLISPSGKYFVYISGYPVKTVMSGATSPLTLNDFYIDTISSDVKMGIDNPQAKSGDVNYASATWINDHTVILPITENDEILYTQIYSIDLQSKTYDLILK